jgi:hypothetical protein
VSRGPNDTRAKRALADAEAQFMRHKRDFLDGVDPTQSLSALSGGLESSKTFYLDPLTIQQQLRNEWQCVDK